MMRDRMRMLAWGLVAVGLLLVLTSPLWARVESERFYQAWLAEDADEPPRSGPLATAHDVAAERAYRKYLMVKDGLRPAWTVVSPWQWRPVVGVGAAVSAFGVLLLASRRPEQPTA